MTVLRRFVSAYVVVAIITPVAHAQAISAPLDALGSIRASVARYVQPATRSGAIVMDGTPINCTIGVPASWTEVKEVRNANNQWVRKVPGLNHVTDLSVSGDFNTMLPFLDWYDSVQLGSLSVYWKNVVLWLYVPEGQFQVAFVKFKLGHCWPWQVTYSQDDGSTTVTVQIAIDTMVRVPPGS